MLHNPFTYTCGRVGHEIRGFILLTDLQNTANNGKCVIVRTDTDTAYKQYTGNYPIASAEEEREIINIFHDRNLMFKYANRFTSLCGKEVSASDTYCYHAHSKTIGPCIATIPYGIIQKWSPVWQLYRINQQAKADHEKIIVTPPPSSTPCEDNNCVYASVTESVGIVVPESCKKVFLYKENYARCRKTCGFCQTGTTFNKLLPCLSGYSDYVDKSSFVITHFANFSNKATAVCTGSAPIVSITTPSPPLSSSSANSHNYFIYLLMFVGLLRVKL